MTEDTLPTPRHGAQAGVNSTVLLEDTVNRTLKICLIVMAWSGVGTFLALELGTWLWWLGTAAGALGGYLTIKWRTVVWAIPIAWRRTTSWRPDHDYWRSFLRAWWYQTVNCSLMLPGIWFLFLVIVSRAVSQKPEEYNDRQILLWTLLPSLATIVLSGASWALSDDHPAEAAVAAIRRIAWRYNFFVFYFWVAPTAVAKSIPSITLAAWQCLGALLKIR